ncbi:hypothetical protein [Pelagicoccus mobilis]
MIRILFAGLVTGLLVSAAYGNGSDKYATIYPDEQGQVIDTVFFDLKSPYAAKQVAEGDPLYNAHTLFADDGFNGIRTSIYGTRDHPRKPRPGKPAHPAPGEVDGKYYEQEVTALKNALAVNPDLKIFASKKLNGPASFPLWTLKTDSDGDGVADRGVDPRKYAILLVDYIEYMFGHGIPTHFLGLDNEYFFNEGRINPKVHVRIVKAFREELKRRNKVRSKGGEESLPVPLLIGPEDYYPNSNGWMDKLMERKGGHSMDIYGTHYYPEDRDSHLKLLEHDLALAGERPKWHTELHWNTRPNADDFDESEDAIGSLWDCIDLGMTGFIWWHYQREFDSFRGDVMREITTHLLGYSPVKVTDFDGEEILTNGKLHTRALRKGNTIRFYALNMSELEHDAFTISLANGSLRGDAYFDQWVDIDPALNNKPLEGTSYVKASGIPARISSSDIELKIPARSVTMVTLVLD